MVQVRDALIELLGADRVLSTEADHSDYLYDAWPVASKWQNQGKIPYRPDVVVRPYRVEEIRELLHWAIEHGVSITPWGAGSSVTGASLPLDGGITLDLSRLNRTIEVNEQNLTVTVEAGRKGDELEAVLNRLGYTLNHSPQSLDRSTAGGWISTRATGQFSSKWGGIEDLMIGFDVMLADGTMIQFQSGPRMAVGPDLRHIFVGAEGTMGIITSVTLKIFRQSQRRIFETLAFSSIPDGIAVMREIVQCGLRPFLVRFYNEAESRYSTHDQSFNKCAMFLGFEGEQSVAEAEYNAAKLIWERYKAQTLGPVLVERWMERRFDFSMVKGILDRPGGLVETIEIADYWDGIQNTYDRLMAALSPFADEMLAHFSHVYSQGTSLYMIPVGQCADDAEAEATLLKIWQKTMEVCLETGAVLSHHHGVGIARKDFVGDALGSSMTVLERVKQVLDPQNVLCPGKLGFPAK
jgi:alkyldihydroxyacetonephosphate synthase